MLPAFPGRVQVGSGAVLGSFYSLIPESCGNECLEQIWEGKRCVSESPHPGLELVTLQAKRQTSKAGLSPSFRVRPRAVTLSQLPHVAALSVHWKGVHLSLPVRRQGL